MPGARARAIHFMIGANMGFRRAVLDEAGGFEDERRIAMDTELGLRVITLGHRVWFHPDAVVVHDHLRSSIWDVLYYAASHAAFTIKLRREYAAVLSTPFAMKSASTLLLASPLIATAVTLNIYLRNPRLLRYLHTVPLVFLTKVAWCWGAARGLRGWVPEKRV
jgi:GT2 family glycosyltransferase